MTEQPLIAIGKIVAPHGVRGDVRVAPLTDFPERFEKLASVLLEDGRRLEIAHTRYHKQSVILKFRGLDDRNAVEALRGKLLKVTREEAVKLPAGHYFIFDIIGLRVYDENGGCIGVVGDVIATGSNDVYVVDREGAQPVLVPAIKDVVRLIDVPGGRMVVKLQEEWE